jgi:hypothetical protein
LFGVELARGSLPNEIEKFTSKVAIFSPALWRRVNIRWRLLMSHFDMMLLMFLYAHSASSIPGGERATSDFFPFFFLRPPFRASQLTSHDDDAKERSVFTLVLRVHSDMIFIEAYLLLLDQVS